MSELHQHLCQSFLWHMIGYKFTYSTDAGFIPCMHDARSPVWGILWSGCLLTFP